MSMLFQTAQTSAMWPAANQLWAAGAVTAVFAIFARVVRGVSSSGAVAGAVICFLLYAGAGAGAFLALVSVFALTWLSTRFGYRRKLRLGTAEKNDGRTASQVLANLAVAGVCAGLSAWFSVRAGLLLATAAALSEAAADTVSSELGQVFSQRPRLITSWQPVLAGTDGAVSWAGTLSGIAAAIVVSGTCVLGGLVKPRWFLLSVLAAGVGMITDSLLGDLLERRQLLNNDWVNFLSTAVAGAVGFLLASSRAFP